MTHVEQQRQAGLGRLVRDAGEEVVSRWRAVLDVEPLGGARELQLEVLSAVAHGNTVRQRRALQRLASRLAEREPELGELVHQLAALRQLLHAVLSERLEAAAADAEHRVNTAIDLLVEECTKSTTQRLTAAAFVDPLTGLRNRHALDRDLPERVALANRGDRPLSVVVVDLDGLKTINDRDGHAAGDQALRALGAALHSALRAGDTAYRIGGDEFLVVLPDTGADEAETVVARVSRTAPSFGWGTATLPADSTDGPGLIALADERLLGSRRNTRRTQDDESPSRSPRPTHQRPRRALAAVALAAAGLLGGGLAFAADGIIGGPEQNMGLTAGDSVTTTTRGRTGEGPTTSTGPRATQSAETAENAARDGVASVADPGTTTTTAGIIAALIEDAGGEPLEVPIPVVADLETLPLEPVAPAEVVTLEPIEPAEVLGEVVERDPDVDPSSPKPEKDHPSAGKPAHAEQRR